MITIEQILKADGDDLSRQAGEALQPETARHDLKYERSNLPTMYWKVCRKCKARTKMTEDIEVHLAANCGNIKCVPDPILLTPDNAFKWRDWAVKKFGAEQFEIAITIIDSYNRNFEFDQYDQEMIESSVSQSFNFGSPDEYIKASCICVLKDKEDK